MNPSAADFVRKCVTAALAFAVSISAFLFVLGFPWHRMGVWPEQELTAAGLHAVTASVALLLGVLVALRDSRALGAVTSAPIMILGLLAISGLALAPFSAHPWQSVYGTLKHGVGGLWHLEMAILAAGAVTVLATRWRSVLFASLFASAFAVVVAYALGDSFGLQTPLRFQEWAGMLAGAVALALAVRSRRLISPINAAALLLLAGGLYVSGNRAVALAALAVVFFVFLGCLPATRALIDRRSYRAGAAVAIALGGLVAMWCVAPAVEAYRLKDLPAAAEGVVSERPEDHINLMDGALGTLWSRSYMIRIIVDDLANNPPAVLHGNGWGSFNEVYERQAREVPGRLFPPEVASASRTYWDVHSKANFHSHNIAAEALNAMGLPGLVLWLAFLGVLAASSRSGLYASVGIATVSTFWFPVTHMTTAVAVLIAAGSSMGRPHARIRDAVSMIAPLPTAAIVSGLAMAAFLAVSLARLENAESEFKGVAVDRNPETCSVITTRFLPEEEASIYLYRGLVNRIMRSEDRYAALFDHATNVALYSCTMRSHSLGEVSVQSMVESLNARAQLAGIGGQGYGIIADDLIAWGRDIDALLAVAPGRTDFIPAYIHHLRDRNRSLMADEARRYAETMSDEDPIRGWLLSVLSDHEGDIAGSKTHMRRALLDGYANLVPASREFIDSVVAP